MTQDEEQGSLMNGLNSDEERCSVEKGTPRPPTYPRLQVPLKLTGIVAISLVVFVLFFADFQKTGFVLKPLSLGKTNSDKQLPFYGGEVSKGAKVISSLPPPDEKIPSNYFLNIAQHSGIPYAEYDPYARGVLQKSWPDDRIRCAGPGRSSDKNMEPRRLNYHSSATPKGMDAENVSNDPRPLIGSYEALGMDRAYCLSATDRWSPYEYEKQESMKGVNYSWGALQDKCLAQNQARFQSKAEKDQPIRARYPERRNTTRLTKRSFMGKSSSGKKTDGDRTAIIVRMYGGMEFTPEIVRSLRALISETALYSGGRYSVFILMEIKDSMRPVLHYESEHQAAVNEFVPAEFRDITILWNMHLIRAWYPVLQEATADKVKDMYTASLQMFSMHAPQFEYLWNIEIDTRWTGHWFDLFANAEAWAARQPRKLQWERAAKHYIPWYHGSLENYTNAIATENPGGGVWGAVEDPTLPYTIEPFGPAPPTARAIDDDSSWGVGEQPDLIALSRVSDYNDVPFFPGAELGFTEHRQQRVLQVQPVERMSKRLLAATHDMMERGLADMMESFNPTATLLHGLKIVRVPLPQFWGGMSDDPTTNEDGEPLDQDAQYDAEPDGAPIASGLEDAAEANRVFNSGAKQGIYEGVEFSTLYYNMGFWGGLTDGRQYSTRIYERWTKKNQRGRLCLPGLLLHPVKDQKVD